MEMTKKYNFTNLSNGRLQLMLQTAEEIHQRMQQPDRPEEAAWKEEFPPIPTAPVYLVVLRSFLMTQATTYFSFSTQFIGQKPLIGSKKILSYLLKPRNAGT